jgi:hypothetical protein
MAESVAVQQLLSSKLRLAEAVRSTYVATVEANTTRDTLLKPDFWAHVANKLRVNDRIEVFYEDGSAFAELTITSLGRNWVKVFELRYVSLTPKLPEALKTQAKYPDGYDVQYKGPSKKWTVLRGSEVIKDGCQEKPEAEAWLDEHIKTVVKAA